MKKIPFALVLALGLASGSAFAASSGTITINGQVMDQTCTIVGAADQTVTLATVAAADLAASGEEAASKALLSSWKIVRQVTFLHSFLRTLPA